MQSLLWPEVPYLFTSNFGGAAHNQAVQRTPEATRVRGVTPADGAHDTPLNTVRKAAG